MKFLINSEDNQAINLANVSEITISCNWLKLITTGGLNSREVCFIYGTESSLSKLFMRIMQFINDDKETVFDCYSFLYNMVNHI